jgi:hypothetical protein
MHGYKNQMSKKPCFFCMLLNEDEFYNKKYRAQHDLKLSGRRTPYLKWFRVQKDLFYVLKF